MSPSRETVSMEQFLADAGVAHRVTGRTEKGHAPKGYHYMQGTQGQGLALDFAGPRPSILSPSLRAIFDAFAVVETQLAELIYSGAPYRIYHGRRVAQASKLSRLYISHTNHLHVAVKRGTFLRWPTPRTIEEATRMINKPAVAFHEHPTEHGYWIFAADGGVFAYGAAKNHGTPYDLPAKDRPKFPIVDGTPTKDGGGYWLTSADGGVYSFGNAYFIGAPTDYIN